MPILPIKGTNIYDTSQFHKPTILIVNNGGEIFDYYVSILKKNCENEYSFLKTDKSIVGTPNVFRRDILKGTSDGDPIVGKPYTISNGGWHTSTVIKIVNDNILITKNSVYVIHNISEMREKKINDLGI